MDARFDAIIDRAMQPEPELRYQSTNDLRRDLEAVRAGLPLPEHTPEPAQPNSLARKPLFPRLAIGGAVGLLALALALVIWWPRARNTGSQRPSRVATTVRDAARWLVKEHADFKILSGGKESDVKSEEDIPEGDFQIVYLWFDRWLRGPPQPPPPVADFEVMRSVKTLRFAFLRLPGLPESAYSFLAQNADLDTLFIEGADASDRLLATLPRLPRLTKLAISNSPRLTGRGLAGAAWLNRIEHLDLLNSGLNDEGAKNLTNCTRLVHLSLPGTPIGQESLRHIASLRRLTELRVGNCRNLSEQDFIEVLPQFQRLKHLDLEHSDYGDQAALAISATLTNLNELRLNYTTLSDEGLANLAKLPQLKTLWLTGTRISDNGLAAFEQARPECKIEQ